MRGATLIDVVVIGGGICGLSVAYQILAQAERDDHNVVLQVITAADSIPFEVDRNTGMASLAAAGMIAPISEASDAENPLIDFGLDSLQRYPDFIKELERYSRVDTDFRQKGTLWVAFDRDDLAELTHRAEGLERLGLASTWLTQKEVLQAEPSISSRVVAGLSVPCEMQIDPYRFTHALDNGVMMGWGSATPKQRVERIVRITEGFEVTCESGLFVRCKNVILAAGAGALAAIDSPLSARIRDAMVMRPIVGQGFVARGVHIDRAIRSPRVYAVPRKSREVLSPDTRVIGHAVEEMFDAAEDGDVYIGATSEDVGFDLRKRVGAQRQLLRDAWRVIPGIDEAELVETKLGFRPATRDHLPIIGEVEPNFYVNLGHHRHGVLLAAAASHYLAWQVITQNPQPELAAFSPRRFFSRAKKSARDREDKTL